MYIISVCRLCTPHPLFGTENRMKQETAYIPAISVNY